MNNMDRWIDPRIRLVKAANVHAYLLVHGWEPKPSPRPQVLVFKEPAGHEGEAVLQTVPANDGVSDCTDALMRVITNLAVVEDRSAVDVLNDILGQTVPSTSNGVDVGASQTRVRKRS